jgi:hypothetical protein
MAQIETEQIIRQMQEWCDNMCENACLKGESLNGKIHTCEICFPNTVKNALSLIKALTEENNRLSFFNEQKAEAVRYEAITKYKKSIIDYYTNDSRYDRPNAHTLLVKLFALLDEKAKEILEDSK